MTKTTGAMITGILVVAAQYSWADGIDQKVTVCLQGLNTTEVIRAKALSGEMFAKIGVVLEWNGTKRCPARALKIDLVDYAKDNEKPGALAYALPFEGTRIVVFLNRIAQRRQITSIYKLLAHVLVHEITHVLQGTATHAATGIMKANWNLSEFQEMGTQPLPFVEEDVELIRRGLAARAAVETKIAAVQPREK